MRQTDFFPPLNTPAHDLATGFAEHAVRWARDCAAPSSALTVLRPAAARLSLAVADGNVCLPLSALDDLGEVGELRRQLLASGVVSPARSTAGNARPFAQPMVLDDAGRLYLRRYYLWEDKLAQALAQRAGRPAMPMAETQRCRHALHQFLRPAADEGPDWQQAAIALALQRHLLVISGGPGTGKTTAIAALLACLATLQENESGAVPLRIALAAPTGKAAARMLEALRERMAELPAVIRASLPAEAHTLHRLLGVTSRPGRFHHHAANPLPVDLLVVDEASMLDLALAARTLDALPLHARLILLGDKDQLAAVEAGAIFSEISSAPSLSPQCVTRLSALTGIAETQFVESFPHRDDAPLCDCVMWLSRSHRFSAASAIGAFAADINAGRSENAFALLRRNGDCLRWFADTAAAPLSAELLDHIRSGYAAYLQAIKEYHSDPQPVFAAFNDFRVLCALHGGPRGVAAINDLLGADMQRRWPAGHTGTAAAASWYPGRPVLILRNDYLTGLFNGDIGICLPDERNDISVCFPAGAGEWKRIAPVRLPEHDTAFAMTVHKSQGSEFGAVLVMLPAGASRVVTRELLYTAVTRAIRHVAVACTEAAFSAACATPTRRHSGLTDRLREQVAARHTTASAL